MKEYIASHLVALVPQWYTAKFGSSPNLITIGGLQQKFYSSRPLTPALHKLLNSINAGIDSLTETPLAARPTFVRLLQEHFAIAWLKLMAPGVAWVSTVNYLNKVAARTNENNQVSMNLVISVGGGSELFVKDDWQKLMDQLATSPFSYIRVNHQLQYLDYKEIKWSEITDPTGNRFYPSFLHPIHCILKENEYSAHVTGNGDIVIMNASGLIASKRKGTWKLYDMATFKNCISDYVKDYWTGAHLFELCFDLSFRRHGALLVYDPGHKVLENVTNPDSLMTTTNRDSGQRLVAPTIQNANLASEGSSLDKRRLLAEIASVDGAVILDKSGILAFGANIKGHPNVDSGIGARTAAARSAFEYGGVPLKVSSDGEVTVYFHSADGENTCPAKVEFL